MTIDYFSAVYKQCITAYNKASYAQPKLRFLKSLKVFTFAAQPTHKLYTAYSVNKTREFGPALSYTQKFSPLSITTSFKERIIP